MSLDHEAIRRSHPEAVVIDDGTGVFDESGNKVTIDQSKVDAARITINSEMDSTKYQRDRASEYPPWEDQLDKIYHNGVNAWKADIKKIKDKYPKPSE